MRGELAIWIYALGAFALAIVGALGVAWLLALGIRDTLIFVGAVALTALFGTFIPILRLGYRRLSKSRAGERGNRRF